MRAFITVIGKDKVGIIAAVCVLLSEQNVNILDISQTDMDLTIRIQREEIFNAMHRI